MTKYASAYVIVQISGPQIRVRFNAALSSEYVIDQFEYVLLKPSNGHFTFQFVNHKVVDGVKAYKLQNDGGGGGRGHRPGRRSRGRVTYVSRKRFDELTEGFYPVERVSMKPLTLVIALTRASAERKDHLSLKNAQTVPNQIASDIVDMLSRWIQTQDRKQLRRSAHTLQAVLRQLDKHV